MSQRFRKKRSISQKISSILDSGLFVYTNSYSRVTNYWDLTGSRKSEQKRHNHEIDKRLNIDENATIKDTKEYLSSCGLVLGEIPIYKAETENWDENKLKYNIHSITETEAKNKDETIITKCLQFKDESLTSDRTYDKMQKVLAPDKPNITKVRKERIRLNSEINKKFKKYRNNYGNFVDCKSYISYQIKKNFERLKIKDDLIQVKLAGDGTKVGKKIKCLNFTFTLPDSGLVAKTSKGNFTLGIFKIKKENRETLKEVMQGITKNLTEFSENPEILINDIPFKVKFLLGGDMKFLHEMMGLSACNSTHCCFVCKIPKEDFYNNDLKEATNCKRSIIDQAEKLKGVKKNFFDVPKDNVDGYLYEPIFSFINYDDIIFDTLHLSLRLPGKLIKLVLQELKTLDSSNSVNLEDLPHQKQFFGVLEKIGISTPYSIETKEESNETSLIIRTFNGDESLRIMEKLDFEEYFPNDAYPKFKNKKKLTFLFQNFHSIFLNLKNNVYIDNPKECERATGEWLKEFLNIFHTKHVTPYLHLFVGLYSEYGHKTEERLNILIILNL